MPACTGCKSELPSGHRWCPICHRSVIDSSVRLASPAKRLAAYFLDVSIPLFAIIMIFGLAGATKSGSFGLLLFIGYVIWAVRLFSQGTTPGKKMLGMRVIKETGEGARFGTMIVREWFGKFISGLLFALGYFWILFDRDRQGWHDKLASTYVVQ